MAPINPLVTAFLDKHPVDCARILEQIDVNTTCSLISIMQPIKAAAVIECMVTSYGSDCLFSLDKKLAVSIIQEMKTPQAARLLRSRKFEDSEELLHMLPRYVRSNIESALKYPDLTVGRVMDTNPVSLPESISVIDAVKRVKHLQGRNIHELFIVDDEHKLKGVILVTDLLSASRSTPLSTILISNVPFLSSRSALDTAAVHAGWKTYSVLPVVGKDHILAGVLKSSTLMHVLAENRKNDNDPDAIDDIFSITMMYWTVLAELINTMAGRSIQSKQQRDP